MKACKQNCQECSKRETCNKHRNCHVEILKGWAQGTCARAVYVYWENCYHILDGWAAHMIYTPDYIREYTV